MTLRIERSLARKMAVKLFANLKSLRRPGLAFAIVVGALITPATQAATFDLPPPSGSVGSMRVSFSFPSNEFAVGVGAEIRKARRVRWPCLIWKLLVFIKRQAPSAIVAAIMEMELQRLAENLPDKANVGEAACRAMQRLSEEIMQLKGLRTEAKSYTLELIKQIKIFLYCDKQLISARPVISR